MGMLPEAKIERLILPSTADTVREWVDLNTTPLAGDMLGALGTNDLSDADLSVTMLAALIKKWSFIDAQGQPEPITADNIRRLQFADLNFLAEKLAAVVTPPKGEEHEKK